MVRVIENPAISFDREAITSEDRFCGTLEIGGKKFAMSFPLEQCIDDEDEFHLKWFFQMVKDLGAVAEGKLFDLGVLFINSEEEYKERWMLEKADDSDSPSSS